MLNCYVRKIETERLILRPITPDDAPDMFEYCSDPETTKYLTFKLHESVEASRDVIAKFFLERPQNGVPEAYAIVLKENGKMIGTVDVHSVRYGDVGEIGYALNSTYWNRGLMSEALRSALPIWFDEVGFYRLEVMHDVRNLASRRVIEKAGFISEGTFRRLMWDKDGSRASYTMYSLNKEDDAVLQNRKKEII